MATPAIINIAEAHIPHEQKSDDTLIALFQNGEKAVFRYLVERYQERVRNLIFSIFNDSQLVDDLSQEVFVKVYEALPNFRFQSSFYTWLYRITVNKSRDEIRKKKVKKIFAFGMFDNDDYYSSNPALQVSFEPDDTRELIDKALQKLPEKYKMPVILKDIDGLSYEEIADVLDCEVGTVKSRLSRGRMMLKDLLKPYFTN